MAELRDGVVIKERFELLAHVGTGGFGSVFRGKDRMLDREVAIKRLTSTQLGGKRDEVLDEARKIAGLTHPNVVSVFDVIDYEHELLIVMEFLHGGTLQDRLRELSRKGAWIDALDSFALLRGILSGLQAAHSAGVGPIVHRDLKPLNIMFERRGTPKLTDFGLAAIGNVAAIETRNPGKWEHEGPFGYKSPEQLRGAAIDARSDLFNVGLIAYLLFGASHPFTDPRFLFDYKEMVLEPYRALPPISLGSASAGIADFLGHLLATEPKDRFASASEALAELDDIEGICRDDLLERVLGLCDFLKGTATQQIVLTLREIAEGICLCKRSGFYVQGTLLYEKSGADFSQLSPALRESLENDYGFCRRRAGQEVEAD